MRGASPGSSRRRTLVSTGFTDTAWISTRTSRPVGAAVFGHYGDRIGRKAVIWISFLGAAACIARREHVAFDVVFMRFSERVRRVLGAGIAISAGVPAAGTA